MQVEFWGSEFKKRKNSTKVPDVSGVVKEVVIKGNFGFENQFQSTKCSIVAPSFFVTGASGYGYCKAWDNYYWITNISFDIDGAEYIECKIDVLASWASFIKESTFFIDRCADPSYYNPDIFDEAISIESGGEVSNSARSQVFTERGGCYLVTVMGRSTTGINTFAFDSVPGTLFNPMYAIGSTGAYDDPLLEQLDTVVDGFNQLFKALLCDPSKYITAVKFAPFPESFFPNQFEQIYVGWLEAGGMARKLPMSTYWERSISINKPTSIYSDFRRTDGRCSMYNIYLPGVGTVDLTPDVMELSLTADLTMNIQTGDVHYNLKAGGSTIGTYDGCVYTDIGFAGSSVNSGAIAQTAGGVGTAIGSSAKKDWVSHDNGISSELEVIKEAKPLMFMGGAIAAIHGAGEAMKAQASLASPMGGGSAVWGDPDIIVSCVQKHTGEFLTNDYGRPCCKNLKIGDLSGFVRCANASIDISSTDSIRGEINAFLNTGFFVE